VTEHFPLSRVNEAFDYLRAGKARYQIVLDNDLCQSLEEFCGRRSVLVVDILAEVANRSIGIDNHRGRMRHRRFQGVHQTPLGDHLEVRVGKQGEANALLGRELGEILRRVGANRPDLGAGFFESFEVFLQLTELTTAEWSPQTAIKN